MMLFDNKIRLYRLPLVRVQLERSAGRARESFDDDPDAIASALKGWVGLKECKKTILPKIIEMSEVVHYPKGYRFITYNGKGNDVFIILRGEALVKTPNGKLPVRNSVTTIGEKRGIDPHAHRTAHVYAKTEIVALKMSGADFRSLREHCRTFERNIDRNMRERHTEAGLPKKKSNQLYVAVSAACLAIALGSLTANQMEDPFLGFVVGLVIFAFALFILTNFVVRAALAIVAGLLVAFQFTAKVDSTGQSIIEIGVGQPTLSTAVLAVVLLIVILVLDRLRL